MSELRYIISDASRRVNVESHVLRYWEEELTLEIPRNEMGHRYYTEDNIRLLKTVKTLKDQGFQLKAIKMLLPDINNIEELDPKSILKLREELNEQVIDFEYGEPGRIKEPIHITTLDHKETTIEDANQDNMSQFKQIINELIVNALKENNNILSKAVSTCVTHGVIKEMDYLLRIKEEVEEERYKKLDETIRDYQKSRQESAASDEISRKGSYFHRVLTKYKH